MKKLILIAILVMPTLTMAQDKIFRCGTEYVNDDAIAKKRNCKQVFPVELLPAEKVKYQNCQQDATKLPTELGVKEGMRLCRVKFGLESDK